MYHAKHEKPPKTTPYLWPKKVETYSSSNALAPNSDEKVSFITSNLHYPSIVIKKGKPPEGLTAIE